MAPSRGTMRAKRKISINSSAADNASGPEAAPGREGGDRPALRAVDLDGLDRRQVLNRGRVDAPRDLGKLLARDSCHADATPEEDQEPEPAGERPTGRLPRQAPRRRGIEAWGGG